MADLTRAEIRDRIAEELGIKQLGIGMSDAYKVRIEQGYDEVYAYLEKTGKATWAATGSVPELLVPYVVDLVVLNCASTFGLSDARYMRLVSRTGPTGDMARAELHKLVDPGYESQDRPTPY